MRFPDLQEQWLKEHPIPDDFSVESKKPTEGKDDKESIMEKIPWRSREKKIDSDLG